MIKQRKIYGGSWRGKRLVKKHNPEQFVNDFYGVHIIVTGVPKTFAFVEIKRRQIWELAQTRPIKYMLRTDIRPSGRTVMLIL